MPNHPPLQLQPHWPADWLSGTRILSLAQRGALIDLLSHSWLFGALPREPIALARILGVGVEEFNLVWPDVASFFRESLAGLINDKLETDRVKARRLKDAAIARARLGGQEAKRLRTIAQSGASSTAQGSASSRAPRTDQAVHSPPLHHSITHHGSSYEQERAPARDAPAPDPEVLRKARKALAGGLDSQTIERQYGLTVAEIQASP